MNSANSMNSSSSSVKSCDHQNGLLRVLSRSTDSLRQGLDVRKYRPGLSYYLHPLPRNYALELTNLEKDPVPATSHPLKAIVVTEVKKADKKGSNASSAAKTASSTPFKDPLSMGDPLSSGISVEFEGSDPLSMMMKTDSVPTAASKGRSDSTTKAEINDDGLSDTFEPWSLKKASILAKYTTSEKLSITTSFLSTSDQERVVIKTQAQAQTGTMSDKVRNRLEQLDDFEEGSVKEMLNLSQQDYVKRIEELNQALITAWDNDHRVKALKIAIQCSKLLADVSVIPFYPSKFVLITDILDTFGRLVYDRLLDKAQTSLPGSSRPHRLSANFTSDEVPEAAKETCRNWFFKIASIRELIPRLYVEAAILKSYNFLNTGEYTDALKRLSLMARGIGDPLVAVYARCYLCRVGILVAPRFKNHIPLCFEDFITTFPQVQGDSVQNILAVQKLEMPRYLTLFSPALDWILQCLAHQASETLLNETLERCKQGCNSALMINSIMSAYQPQYIANRALVFTEMIKECEDTGLPKHLLHRTLGLCLVVADTPADQQLPVLNEVWKAVVKLKNPGEYISCAEVWIEYVVKHFGKREINTFLGDIIKHMTPDRAYEDFYPQLQSVVTKIMAHQHDFSLLFSLEKFLPFIDMFQRETIKVEVCKCVLESFVKHQTIPINDPVVINAMMFLGKIMHDSVDALTLEDEKRVIGNLLCGFVRLVQFGRDFEQQLSFYVESRAYFSNLDSVLMTLLHCVNNLSVETRKVVKGNHSRKTAAFVRACAAYCFITIPSLQSVYSQLQLYLLSGQVALLNQCYSQGDAFLKGAISLIPDMPKTMDVADSKSRSSEPFLIEYLYNFVSTLLVTPDNPDMGVMYLLRGLLNVLQDYTWETNSDARVLVYTRVLAMLSAASQEEYPYHIDKVDSNDSMYGNDPKFLSELKKVADTLIGEILAHLKTVSAPELAKRQSSLIMDVIWILLTSCDMSKSSISTLTINLWTLAQKNGQADVKVSKKLQDLVKGKAAAGTPGFSGLQAKFSIGAS